MRDIPACAVRPSRCSVVPENLERRVALDALLGAQVILHGAVDLRDLGDALELGRRLLVLGGQRLAVPAPCRRPVPPETTAPKRSATAVSRRGAVLRMEHRAQISATGSPRTPQTPRGACLRNPLCPPPSPAPFSPSRPLWFSLLQACEAKSAPHNRPHRAAIPSLPRARAGCLHGAKNSTRIAGSLATRDSKFPRLTWTTSDARTAATAIAATATASQANRIVARTGEGGGGGKGEETAAEGGGEEEGEEEFRSLPKGGFD